MEAEMFVMDAPLSSSSSSPQNNSSRTQQQRANGCVTQAADDTTHNAALVQPTSALTPDAPSTSSSSTSSSSSSTVAQPTDPAADTLLPDRRPRQTTMLASCEPPTDHLITPAAPSLNWKLKLNKKIKAKYGHQQQAPFSYARLREHRLHTKTGAPRSRKISCGDSRVPNGMLGGEGRQERSSEMPVSKVGSVPAAARQLRGGEESRRGGSHIPRAPQTPPSVTSSTLDNEARITQVAETLGIPKDPKSWSSQQVQQWLSSTLDSFYARHLATLTVDGALLCLLSKDQLQQRVPDFTSFMVDALDTWKQEAVKPQAFPLVSSTETKSQQTLMNSRIENVSNGWEHNNNVLSKMDANYDKPSYPEFSGVSGDKNVEQGSVHSSNDVDSSIGNAYDVQKFPAERDETKHADNRRPENRRPLPENQRPSLENQKHTPQIGRQVDSPVSQVTEQQQHAQCISQPHSPPAQAAELATYRQFSTESSEGALVIDEQPAASSISHHPVLPDAPKLLLEEATEKEQKYITEQCTNNELQKLESVVAKTVPEVAAALTSSNVLIPKAQQSHEVAPPHGLKRRKSENERLKGFSKKLKLKITPQNSVDKEEEQKVSEPVFTNREPHSAPILANAYNKGYQDASRLKELILKSKLSGIPFFPGPMFLSTSPATTPTEMPKIELQVPNVPFSPITTTPHTPRTPPPLLTPVHRSPTRRPSPLAASPHASMSIKQEPTSPPAAVSSSSSQFLKIPTPFFRTPSPVRTGGSPNSAAAAFQNGFSHYHDPDKPLDLSSDSKRNTPIPTPSPSALFPHPLLPRSFSMPMGMDSELPEISASSCFSTMIHPLALSGSSFTRQPSTAYGSTEQGAGVTGSTGSGSSGYMSMSSVEGDSDLNETETPSAANVGNPQYPASPLTGSSSSPSISRIGRIKLWEFLLELLADRKQSCIRWLSQDQGTFKIENSEQVASLWGNRKGLSAMNYDKLSRSIRQYYKQGIIQKTRDSKRLVYQFDRKYMDMHNSRYHGKYYSSGSSRAAPALSQQQQPPNLMFP